MCIPPEDVKAPRVREFRMLFKAVKYAYIMNRYEICKSRSPI